MQVEVRTAVAEPHAPSDNKPRLDWVDNLRTLTIVLVVNMHACVTYSHVGSWYYNSPPEPPIAAKIPFVLWQAHLQSFFMGLLFYIGGYYADRSLSRRGAKSYVVERFRRLGAPALLYMLAIQPLIVYVLHPGYEPSQTPLQDYARYVLSGRFLGGSGPMWFAVALLIFSLVFVPFARRLPKLHARPLKLNGGALLAIAVGVGFVSFLVRTVQPLGTSVLNMQLAYFVQYCAAFPLGVWVSRRDWLAALPTDRIAKISGWVALAVGPITLLAIIYASLPIREKGPQLFEGGWNPLAFSLATWEQVVGISLGLGAMALCARYFNARTMLSAWLSDRSFAVYLLHPPILVALALLIQPYRMNPFVMMLLLTVFGLASSFVLADLAKRAPGLRQLL